MGEHGSGAGIADGARPLKPPPDRLYGRARGHALRRRQQRLLDVALPRLAFPPELAGTPLAAFGAGVREVWLEVGAGGGEHALDIAAAHRDAGLIACEVYENGLCSLLAGLLAEGTEASAPAPDNLRIWADDARALLRLLPASSLARLFLMFPDPWPKSRHAKRRFVHPAMVAQAGRVLRPGAEWRIATDDPTYQAWVREVMDAQTLFAPAAPMTARPSGWPPTRYEAKALRSGRAPLYWTFVRT